MTATIKIPDEVRAVLARSTITADSVKLPEQLDRALYVAVNKVLTVAGGKWHRSRGAHIFTTDPREKLGLAIENGEVVNVGKLYQAFYTPDSIAQRVRTLAGIETHERVLEPSAGEGALAKKAMPCELICVELNPDAAKILTVHRRPGHSAHRSCLAVPET